VARMLRSNRSVRALTVGSSLICATMAICCAVALAQLSDSSGSFLLGDTWIVARPALVPTGLWFALQMLAIGPQIGLMASGRLTAVVRLRGASVLLLIVGIGVGAASGDLVLALYSAAASAGAAAAAWWVVWTAGHPSPEAEPLRV
jgi:hypothetical protein